MEAIGKTDFSCTVDNFAVLKHDKISIFVVTLTLLSCIVSSRDGHGLGLRMEHGSRDRVSFTLESSDEGNKLSIRLYSSVSSEDLVEFVQLSAVIMGLDSNNIVVSMKGVFMRRHSLNQIFWEVSVGSALHGRVINKPVDSSALGVDGLLGKSV